MSIQRFTVACAQEPNVIRRTSRQTTGDLVLGFSFRDTPAAKDGKITIARMIGMGRTIDEVDLRSMMDAIAASPNIGTQLVMDAVENWLWQTKARMAK